LTPGTEEPPTLPPEFSPDPNRSPAFNIKAPDEQATKNNDNDDAGYSSTSDWERSDDEEDGPEELPDPLKIGGGKPIPTSNKKDSLPDVLKAGPPPRVVKQKSLERISPEPTGTSAASWGAASAGSGGSIPLQTNNPYLRMQNTGQSNYGAESSQNVWGDAERQTPQTHTEPVELPSNYTPDTPINRMANLTLDNGTVPHGRSQSIDQPPLIAVESPTPQQTPQSAGGQGHGSTTSHAFGPAMEVSSIDAWASARDPQTNKSHPTYPQDTAQEELGWGRGTEDNIGTYEATERTQQEAKDGEVHRVEQASTISPTSPPFEDVQTPSPAVQTPVSSHADLVEEQPPAMPPRPVDTGASAVPSGDGESPTTLLNRQRKEHYPIKKIRWFDASSRKMRESPILTQNINGPCPLLALVNALVLSTPQELKTEFVETLRTREQLSLGLLVDAVIEELMSGRRGTELGDINELYKFLIGLQTGMNVNPMFVHDPEASDGSTTQSTLSASKPGGFENTRDMRLYKTFNVPLLHGWLPEPGSEAYRAFERVAKTYESAQLVQFQEEELDAKLQAEGLNAEEQQLFTDIHAIKDFLAQWPTQLTDYGIRNMQEAIRPGQVGILFRNDHFSTLYKNPHTDELMTLVTDQGYSSHEEIVWESLVDVSGRGSELYSGDFRAVGNNTLPQRQQQQDQRPVQSLVDMEDDQGWTTVSNNRRRPNEATSSTPAQSQAENGSPANPGLSRTEQEDHDLALALQLQEEEEDRHRRSVQERRRRESQLSEEAISPQGQQRPGNRRTPRQSEYPPLIPPRRNNLPTTHRPNNEAAPPPTYEEAATSPQYHPPQGHPANPNTPLRPQGNAHATNSQNPSYGPGGARPAGRPLGQVPPALPARPGRRQSGVVGANAPGEREKCVVM
jgi:hypothetical protein